MRSLVIFVCFTISWADGQNGRGPQHDPNGHGWDIRLTVPGEPGRDYPTLGRIPKTSFSCAGREPGYYADSETNCQVFRVCTVRSTYGFQSFLCPNGTLFNQGVFVCDWWMNVDCQRQVDFLNNNNNEKFGNLRLGPQLMKDIKKMLTHPMRNPYDKNTMKSNIVVMQEYKPPSGQLFPNGALLAGPERPPSNVYVPTKQIINHPQSGHSTSDTSFGASTPNPQYIPFNPLQPTTQRSREFFQRNRKNEQYLQSSKAQNLQNWQSENIITNGHTGRLVQIKKTPVSNSISKYNKNTAEKETQFNQRNTQYNQKQINILPTQLFDQRNSLNTQNVQIAQTAQYTNIPPHLNGNKESTIENSLIKQQYSSNQDNRYVNKTPLPQSSTEIIGQVHNEAKQNLVSKNTPTATTERLDILTQDLKNNNPKPRIIFKTWVVKSPKYAKSLTESTPYVYDKPTNPTLNTFKSPTVFQQATQTLLSRQEPQLYFYNKPTVAAKIIATIEETPKLFAIPNSTQPTVTSHLTVNPLSALPTKSLQVKSVPTTYKPLSRFYLPVTENTNKPKQDIDIFNNEVQQSEYFKNAKLISTSTTTTPAVVLKKENHNIPFVITKHSHINTNHNNITFTDTLTKEKLNITVSSIIKDTSKILGTVDSTQFGQLRQEDYAVQYPEKKYLSPENNNESKERLATVSPTIISKSSRTLTSPSNELEPPIESYNTINHNINLPQFKESTKPTNTIERTISLKITIPEKFASYLFKSPQESGIDRLEILNTGNSNYLVLANYLNKNAGSIITPLGKLIIGNKSNISNSQALVFSFLADSFNVAREYRNTEQENIKSSTPIEPQFQNVNTEELTRITNKIAHLTSSQYSYNNNISSANTTSTIQAPTNNGLQYSSSTPYMNNFTQNLSQQKQNTKSNTIALKASAQDVYSSQFQNSANISTEKFNSNLQTNDKQNQIYSGQLYQVPVPDALSELYNSVQNSVKIAQLNDIPEDNVQTTELQEELRNWGTTNMFSTIDKPTNAEVQIVRSHSLPLPVPAKLQVASSNELYSLNSQENSQSSFANIFNSNGISAQIHDRITGNIAHPVEDNKLLTYNKDQSYYLYTKLGNDGVKQNIQSNDIGKSDSFTHQRNVELDTNNNANDVVTIQFIPSVSYQLEDEKEQQKVLETFQIDEFGSPKKINNNKYQAQNIIEKPDVARNVDYSAERSNKANEISNQSNSINRLYAGPSSYLAPQASIGNLEGRQFVQSKVNSQLEEFEEQNNSNNNGYYKLRPSHQYYY